METLRVVEPRARVTPDEQRNHVVLQGGQLYTNRVEPANSYSQSQADFRFQPPSISTIIDRNMKVKCTFLITADADFDLGVSDALRQFPLASILETLEVSINGESISINTASFVHAMLCFENTQQQRAINWSETAAMPDNFQDYGDWFDHGSARNPLASYGENSAEMTRGALDYELVASNQVRVTVTEPFLMSPFLPSLKEDEGFVNVTQMSVNFRWRQDLQRVWSHASTGNAITTLDVQFERTPELHLLYITPDLLQNIPPSVTYPYHKMLQFNKVTETVASGATTSQSSDTVRFSQIPRKMYVFATRSRNTRTFETSDSFARLDRVNVLWNNQDSLFGAATSQQLYQISKKNGINLSWPQWSKHRGGVFCFELGTDLGLPDGQAPGVQGQFSVQVQTTFTNTSGAPVEYELWVLAMLEGTLQIFPDGARASLGNLNQQTVIQAEGGDEISYENYSQLAGAGFFDGVSHLVNKLSRGVQIGAQIAGQAGLMDPRSAALLNLAGAVGSEASGGQSLPMFQQPMVHAPPARAPARGAKGGSMVGGRATRKVQGRRMRR
ncbi:MAG: phage major capsid domain-containing protein [Planctomycetota bacterium]|jgi:hypothetical protein